MADRITNLMGEYGSVIQIAALALITILVIAGFVRLSLRLANRFIEDPVRINRTSRTIRRIGFAAVLIAMASWFTPNVGDFYTILTVVGAGLAIAMRESVLSFVGRAYIGIASPYRRGDRIEINRIRGDVIDIRMLSTVLMEIGEWVVADQSTGRLLSIPNGWVFVHALKNYSRGFRFVWNEMAVTVTFRSNWKTAQDILLSLASEMAHVQDAARKELHEMSREYLIYYSILTPFVYVRIMDNGVRLTLRYLCDVKHRRGSEHAITVSFLDAIREAEDVELALPGVMVSHIDGRPSQPTGSV